MSFESPEQNNQAENEEQESRERIRDRIVSPHAEAVLRIFEKRFSKEEAPVDIETIKDILYSFVEQAIEHTEIYSSEKFNVSFPYTRIDTAELSKTLFGHYKDLPKSTEDEQTGKPEESKEFVFGSFINTGNGGQFTFFEEAMHQLVKQLPGALETIAGGKEPDHDEVYVMGSPTNELGTMSPEFLESLKGGNSFKQFGALYADFIESHLPQDEQERENLHLYLYGISMGGSFATQAAEQLLAAKKITQSHEESKQDHLPFTQIRVDTLPGASDSPLKRWQIPLGFVADSVYTLPTNAYTRTAVLQEGKSAAAINQVLVERGIVPNMTPEQKKMKEEAIWGGSSFVKGIFSGEDGVINDLRKGIPIDEDLKLTEVRGIYDPLQYSDSFRREVQQQRKEHAGSLGENTVSVSENRRRVGIDQAHTLVFLRENELKRIEKVASDLEGLKT